MPLEEHRPYQAASHPRAEQRPHAADLTPYVEALDGFVGTGWDVAELALVRSNLPVYGVRGSSRGTR